MKIYEKTLKLTGVGFRANLKGKQLNLQLGFSHDINYDIPEGITIKEEKQTTLIISGIDKELVGKVVADFSTEKTSPEELAENMVGRKVLLSINKPSSKIGKSILEVADTLPNFYEYLIEEKTNGNCMIRRSKDKCYRLYVSRTLN